MIFVLLDFMLLGESVWSSIFSEILFFLSSHHHWLLQELQEIIPSDFLLFILIQTRDEALLFLQRLLNLNMFPQMLFYFLKIPREPREISVLCPLQVVEVLSDLLLLH